MLYQHVYNLKTQVDLRDEDFPCAEIPSVRCKVQAEDANAGTMPATGSSGMGQVNPGSPPSMAPLQAPFPQSSLCKHAPFNQSASPLTLPQLQMQWLPTPWQCHGQCVHRLEQMGMAQLSAPPGKGLGCRNRARSWVLPQVPSPAHAARLSRPLQGLVRSTKPCGVPTIHLPPCMSVQRKDFGVA